MKECVLFSLWVKPDASCSLFLLGPITSSLSPHFFIHLAPEEPLNSTVFLHLVHPFALQEFSVLVTHIKQYRAYLGSLTPKGQNAQIAKDILIDVVDNSGIDFAALEALLTVSRTEVQILDSQYFFYFFLFILFLFFSFDILRPQRTIA